MRAVRGAQLYSCRAAVNRVTAHQGIFMITVECRIEAGTSLCIFREIWGKRSERLRRYWRTRQWSSTRKASISIQAAYSFCVSRGTLCATSNRAQKPRDMWKRCFLGRIARQRDLVCLYGPTCTGEPSVDGDYGNMYSVNYEASMRGASIPASRPKFSNRNAHPATVPNLPANRVGSNRPWPARS